MSVAEPLMMSAPMNLSQQDQWKRAAAEDAAKLVESGMVVGLGTGSTAAFLVSALGRRVAKENLRIVGIPTSERTAEHARSLNIPLNRNALAGSPFDCASANLAAAVCRGGAARDRSTNTLEIGHLEGVRLGGVDK